jgi:hypothetical protein
MANNPKKTPLHRTICERIAISCSLISDDLERQPGDLGVFRGVAEGVAEEARTRGFASLTLVSFAFVLANHRTSTNLVNSGIYLE